MKLLARLLRTEATFIDIGANQGEFSIAAAGIVSVGKVISFEPVTELRERLMANIELNGFRNVLVMPFALGDVDAELPIFDQRHEFYDGTRHEGLPSLFMTGSRSEVREIVRCRRLDDVLTELVVERVDIIKLDIEGAEWSALRGATNTLARFRPVLILEIARETCRAAGYEPSSFAQWIIDQGYQIEIIKTGGVSCPVQPKQLGDFQNIIAYPLQKSINTREIHERQAN